LSLVCSGKIWKGGLQVITGKKGRVNMESAGAFPPHLAALKPPKETVPSIIKRNGALIKDLLPLL